ncbi:DJ-1/PfpI family protein [candidate division WOR-3 bacterium]|nr:DJ-1/PfpI family protein [candidate division WOR-3 bacterium]
MLYLFFITLLYTTTPAELTYPLQGTNIVFVISQKNFRDEEYLIPREIFEGLGAEVSVASEDTTTAIGMLEVSVKPDMRLDDISLKDFDVIILVGGSGSVVFWGNEHLHKNLIEAADSGRIIGAICLAPGILARAGLLKERKATICASPGAKKLFEEEDVIYTGNEVERDKNIVTADGPAASKVFADEIISVITEVDNREKEND